MKARRFHRPILLLVALLGACRGTVDTSETVSPVVLIGIDGASWNAIRQLWDQDDLPHFRALAQQGVTAELKPVASASPVIWTSIATGVRPERHGITNFVVPTAAGDVPVSSKVRRVPAIWNMVSTAHRRVAALGWWASWPAEKVNGVVVTDRAVRSLAEAFWPPEFADTFEEIVTHDRQADTGSATSQIAVQDRALAAVSGRLVSQGFDLLMVYFRNVDAESHPNWKYLRPQDFETVDPERLERLGQRVPDAYRDVDRALGELRAAADPRTNFFVVSDHGFRAVKRKQYRINLDLDRVLEHLGYLQHQGGDVDWPNTQAASWDSATGMRIKLVRFGLSNREPLGPVQPEDLAALRERLAADLAQVTYTTGASAFRVREPKGDESGRGADLTVVIRQKDVANELEFRGQRIPRAISSVHEITGSHDANTEGIFIAAGPDIDPAAKVERVHSLDVTPTLLYAMNLPIAQDFDGRPQTDLFRAEFRRRHPVHTIATWGVREPGEAITSEVDDELIEELRALGYLD